MVLGLATFLLLSVAHTQATAPPKKHAVVITGTVLGVDGRPSRSAIVGPVPVFNKKGDRYRFEKGTTTDSQGHFKVTVEIPYTRFVLSAFNADQTEGAYMLESEEKAPGL